MRNNAIIFLILLSFLKCFVCIKELEPLNKLIISDLIRFYTLQGGDLSSVCKNQSDVFYKEAIKTDSNNWALRMIDASTKLQSGILSLNTNDYGVFDQCIKIKAPDFNGKYCLASLTFSSKKGESMYFDEQFLLERKTIHAITKHIQQFTEKINYDSAIEALEDDQQTSIQTKWSICVPAGCSAEDVENHLTKAFGPMIKVSLSEANCQTIPLEPKLTGGDWAFVSFLIIVGLIVILSTIYDIYNEMSNKDSNHPILTAFSWYTNGKKLVSINKGDQISCLNGIRFLSMMWVIGGHQFATMAASPLINKADTIPWMSHWSSLITLGSTVSVDSFFCLSGCLLMYGFLKSRAKGVYFNIPLMYLHRYLRLTPALMVVVIFQITIFPYISSGPVWKSAVPLLQKGCIDYWWSVLLYVQNYVNPNDMCLLQTWYLQVDMQLFILSPLILLPIAYWPKYTKYIFTVLIITFILTPFGIAYYYKLEPGTNQFSNNPNYNSKYYMATQARAATWIIGLALGYLIYNTKNVNVIKSRKISAIGWTITAIVMLYVLFGLYPNQRPSYNYNRWYASLFIALHRVAWTFGLSWIVFACVQGYGGIVNTILSLNMFQVLGRLSYSMYLLHCSLLTVEAASVRVPMYFTNKFVIFTYWGTFMYTLILSVIWVLCFEYPIAAIDVFLFSQKKSTKGN